MPGRPVIVVAASGVNGAPLALWGADTSYAIYRLHYPVILIVATLGLGTWAVVASDIILVLSAGTIDRLYDRPIRRYLLRLSQDRSASQAAQG